MLQLRKYQLQSQQKKTDNVTVAKIPTVNAEITNFSTKFREKLITHPNELTPALLEEEDPRRLTLRLLMSYKYGAPILDVSRSHTTTQHSR